MTNTGISLSFASGRGGAGKSTICANTGVALTQLGLKTVVVDADVEGASISMIFGLDFDVPTIHDYLSGRASEDEVVFTFESAGVDLVVGSVKIESLKDVEFDRLKDFIAVLKEKYDIVLVDIPPGVSIDTMTSLAISDAVILVVTPDVLSISSALKTKVLTKGMDLKILGVIVNRTGGEYDVPVPYIEDMLGLKVLSNIAEDSGVKKSLSVGKIHLLNSPNSTTTKSITNIAVQLVGESR